MNDKTKLMRASSGCQAGGVGSSLADGQTGVRSIVAVKIFFSQDVYRVVCKRQGRANRRDLNPLIA